MDEKRTSPPYDIRDRLPAARTAAGEAALRAIDERIARWKARCDAEYAEWQREYRERHAAEIEAEQRAEDQRERERILRLIGDALSAGATPEKRKRRPLTFKKRDVSRAVAGHMQAGLSVQRTEIDKTGRIVIVTGQPEPVSIVPKQPEDVSEWD
jgi:hypothetical protein